MTDSSTPDPRAVASTGIEGLDAVLSGGLPRGHLYLVEGHSGTGKTTLGLQFVLTGAACGERVLYITLTESEAELREGAASHGWSWDDATVAELLLPDELVNPAQAYDIFEPADLELGEQTQRIREVIERHRPQRLVVDSVTVLRLLAADPLRHRRHLEFLRRFLERQDCTTLLIDEILEQPGNLQPRSLVHGIITLEEVMMQYGTSRQRLRVTKMRGVHYPHAWHDYRILPEGIQVYPHLVAAEFQASHPPGLVSTGIEALDTMLGGGLGRGRCALLLGPPGSGKSTLILYALAAAARRGERALCYVFNETVEALVERGEALGLELKDHLEAGQLQFEKVDPNEVSPGEFAFRIRREVETLEAQMVVLDSVEGYMNAMPEQPFLVLHFHELLTYLSRQGVMALMAMSQSSPTGAESAAPVDLATLVDTVLLVRLLDTDQGLQPLLWAFKHRSGPHDRRPFELHITDQGLTVGPPRPDLRGLLPEVSVSLREQEAPGFPPET